MYNMLFHGNIRRHAISACVCAAIRAVKKLREMLHVKRPVHNCGLHAVKKLITHVYVKSLRMYVCSTYYRGLQTLARNNVHAVIPSIRIRIVRSVHARNDDELIKLIHY
jgi:hypothetical protein